MNGLSRRSVCLLLELVLLTSLCSTADAQCDQALGLESGTINDTQITASSVRNSYYAANKARLHNNGFWSNNYRESSSFLKVDFLSETTVTAVAIQGATNGWYTKTFRLFYSLDDMVWEPYTSFSGDTVLTGSSNSRDVYNVTLVPLIQARYLAINPVSWSGAIGLRLELYGCPRSQSTPVRPTLVTGDIEDTQEWIPSRSPYIINGLVVIRPAGKLTIQPGVKVIFNSVTSGLQILGSLRAEGLSGLPVGLWSSKIPMKAASDWRGIEVIQPGTLFLSFADIRRAVHGVKGPVDSITIKNSRIYRGKIGINFNAGGTNASRVTIDGVDVRENEQWGIYGEKWIVSSNKLFIKNSLFERNSRDGIRMSSTSDIRAENCSFSYNSGYGIHKYNSYEGSFFLTKCWFRRNSGYGVYAMLGSGDGLGTFSVVSCKFDSYYQRGIYLYVNQLKYGARIQIRDSKFTQRAGIQVSGYIYKRYFEIELLNNTFTKSNINGYPVYFWLNRIEESIQFSVSENVFSDCNDGIHIEAHGNIPKLNLTISDNTFTRVTHDRTLSVNADGAQITDNTFVNCTSKHVVYLTGTRWSLTRNLFLNPGATYDVTITAGFMEKRQLNAAENFWGSIDMHYIRSRVCDFYCDFSKAIVNLEPFFSTNELLTLVQNTDSQKFSLDDTDNIGGQLENDITLVADQSFVVARSIFVPKGVSLTVPANVSIKFKYKQGIYVRGSIHLLGQQEGTISLVKGSATRWGGLILNHAENSTIQYTVIENAEKAISLSTNTSDNLEYDHLTITKCSKAIEAFPYSVQRLHFRHAVITDNTYGLQLQIRTQDKVKVTFSNSFFRKNSQRSISVEYQSQIYGDAEVQVISSRFDGTSSYYGIYMNKCGSKMALKLLDTVMVGYQYSYTIFLQGYILDVDMKNVSVSDKNNIKLHICGQSSSSLSGGNISLENSSFRGTHRYGGIKISSDWYSRYPHSVFVSNNTFDMRYSSNALEITPRYVGWNITIDGNTFKTNGGWASYFSGKCSQYHLSNNLFHFMKNAIYTDVFENPEAIISVTGNKLQGGQITLHARNVLSTLIDFSENVLTECSVSLKTPDIVIYRNIFVNGSSSYDLKFDITGFRNREINATHNYWGTTDVKEISRRIYDSSYSETLPKIHFIPFYGFANLTESQYPTSTFLSSDGTIGGNVGGSVTLVTNGSPYVVESNIIVGKQDALTIEPGVSLLFQENLKMVVEGTLHILGNDSHPVQAVSYALGKKWWGIQLVGHEYAFQSAQREKIRLVGGSDDREGRIEVQKNGTWSTVCRYNFDLNDGMVVCRMLGFDPTGKVTIARNSAFSQGIGSILYGNLECTGAEKHLDECPVSGKVSCSHYSDVGIRCEGKSLNNPEDVVNVVRIQNLIINNTIQGISVNGNVTHFESVASYNSDGYGIEIISNTPTAPIYNFKNLTASKNKKGGVRFAYYNTGGLRQISIGKCEVHDNVGNGFDISGLATISVSGCSFRRNTLKGIQAKELKYLDLNVSESILDDNKEHGIYIDPYPNTNVDINFLVLNSIISNHNLKYWTWRRWRERPLVFLLTRNPRRGKFLFANNMINNNYALCIQLDTESSGDHYVELSNNTFNENSGMMLEVLQSKQKEAIMIRNNTFVNNTTPRGNPFFKIVYSRIDGNEVDISNNIFQYNQAVQLISLQGKPKISNLTSIMWNSFLDNNVQQAIKTTVFDIVARNNTFDNPRATCEVDAPGFDRRLSIDARWNYWGHTELSLVLERICGFDTDMTKGFVYYIPFILSHMKAVESASKHGDILIPEATGGVVDADVKFSTALSPYTIKRSILIRPDATLVIEAGVQMQFEKGRGIYADGLLIAGDSSGLETTLTSAPNSSWHGLVFPLRYGAVSKRVRLAGGRAKNEGRLEVFYKGAWGTVCSYHFSQLIGRLVCQELGYGSPQLTIHYAAKNAFGAGKGPVLYRLRCSDESIALGDCKFDEWNTTRCNHDRDVGVVCNDFIAFNHTERSSLTKTNILGSKKGLLIDTNTLNISSSLISGTNESGITLTANVHWLNLNGTVISDSNKYGIVASKDVLIQSGTVRNSKNGGISVSWKQGNMIIDKMKFINNNGRAVNLNLQSGPRRHIAVHILNSKFVNQSGDYALFFSKQSRYSYIDVEVKVSGNTFINNTGGSVRLEVPHIENYARGDNNTISFTSNTFLSSGPVDIQARYRTSVVFSDNKASSCNSSLACFMTINVHENNKGNSRNINVTTNSFENMVGRCVVLLKSSSHGLTDNFLYNQIFNSKLDEAGILLDSQTYNLSYNILDNPSTDYELKVLKNGKEVVLATNNWWGSRNIQKVATRILDKRQDQRLLSVQFEPILTDQEFDCSVVKNCSGRGECVRPNGCRCESGWAGSDCSQYDCSGIGHCSGNGDCIGPNKCECYSGWTGKSCAKATCYRVANCSGSGRGFCVLPDQCQCFPQFQSADCSRCAPQRWGSDCLPCPRCLHGTCNLNNGNCNCEGDNWTGSLCDRCIETFYGPRCLPFVNVLNAIPNIGPDKGNTLVHVWGHNFPSTNNNIFYCKFGSSGVVNGTWISREHVTCPSPQHSSGNVYLEVSSDGKVFTRNKTVFTYYAVCPPGACGRNMVPPHGQCLYGGCVCNLPWSGSDCSVELKSPVITPVTQFVQIKEGDEYKIQLSITQGSPPVEWSLASKAPLMTINERTGLVQWERSVAKVTPYDVKAVASNLIGKSSVTWKLSVPLSYSAVIDQVLPGSKLSVPQSTKIKGHVTFFDQEAKPLIALVDVKIRNKGKTRTLSAFTTVGNPTLFEVTYYPKADDSGRFSVDARHPADTTFAEQDKWTVMGMRCNPTYVSKQAFLDTSTVELQNVATLDNTGVDRLENITARVDGTGGPLQEAYIKVGGISSINDSQSLIQSLESGASVRFSLVLTASTPLIGTVAVIFTTKSGTTARMRIRIQLNVKKPVLKFSPSSLTESITLGKQKNFQIEVTNLGDVPAQNLTVLLPSDQRIGLASFSKGSKEYGKNGLLLGPSEYAVISLTVTPAPNDALGEMRGSIALNSELTTANIRYTFYLTSLNKMNLTVKVEDEYTYFASGKPLVSGAVVRLYNRRRRYDETRVTTNETGIITFENVNEDRYTLSAKAPGHSSYSFVLLAKVSEPNVTIFLERIAVKYTWTVTPTTIQDKYIITLESTFETQVPMPVVTIEPAKVNLIPFLEGRKSIMEFVITNHGLIKADNLRFQLPTSHPSLTFIQETEAIGSLPANTSLVLQIRVQLKSRTKRNAAAASVCGLKLLYDMYCGGTKTKGLDVTLTQEYPGRRPLPCGLSGPGGSSPGGGGGGYVGVSGTGSSQGTPSGNSITYNPVTPLSCDCAKTMIKSCALAFHPIAGCAVAVTGTATSFWGAVKGFFDTAFACVVGIWCTLCSVAYSVLWCIHDLVVDCGSQGRRRRDVSSEVLQELINSAEGFRNYMQILDEIFGDKKMYEVQERAWLSTFNLGLTESSPGGTLLTDTEVTAITSLVNDTRKEVLSKFLYRWNNTMSAWENGSLPSLAGKGNIMSYSKINTRAEQYKTDTQKAKDRGFPSIFDYFDNAVNVYKENEKKQKNKDKGVCAKVRVRIVQELVLTRDAFNARLEIENGEESSLQDIRVTVEIRATYGTSQSSNDKFSIGSPKLVGITGVDGSGNLKKGISGTAEWLIIPYSNAAEREDTLYDVGGRLSYTVGGSNFSVPLLPDTITVRPNPSLIVNYFHEKYVQADDPMTQNITEPVVPFSLAVMITNAAYGVARQLKITSAQPEIIENQKGLLISFKIIGAQLGNKSITPSLSVDFGDIDSFQTKTARWLLTSTLKGKFYNYSATFENINPLGDPQLSLLDKLAYHDLIHLVRIEAPGDDGLDDFLVNDAVDDEEIPDALFDSSNGLYSYHVVYLPAETFTMVRLETRGSRLYKFVNLSVTFRGINMSYTIMSTVYSYTRLVNNLTLQTYNEKLLQVTREDKKEIMPEKNAWLSSHYHDKFYFHLFDLHMGVSKSAKTSYRLVFGPINTYSPKLGKHSYEIVSGFITRDTILLQVNATDRDGDNVVYEIESNNSSFVVERITGNIKSTKDITEDGNFRLTLTAIDDGFPVRKTQAEVLIQISSTLPAASTTAQMIVSTLVSTSSSTSPISTGVSSASLVTDRSSTTAADRSSMSTRKVTGYTLTSSTARTSVLSNRPLFSTPSSPGSSFSSTDDVTDYTATQSTVVASDTTSSLPSFSPSSFSTEGGIDHTSRSSITGTSERLPSPGTFSSSSSSVSTEREMESTPIETTEGKPVQASVSLQPGKTVFGFAIIALISVKYIF